MSPAMDTSSSDYYRRLRLPRSASQKEIKAAFRRLARQHHPDLHPNRPDAARKFQALREAYEVLSDRIRRQNYDDRTANAGYASQSFTEPLVDFGKTPPQERPPQSPPDFYIRGIRQALAHRYSAALADYSKALALDPQFVEAYLRRAEVHYLLENDSGVLADCQQAIALDATDPKLHYYQGLARYRLGYVQSAIPAFSNAIARDSEDARFYNWRAIAAQDLGDIEEAAQDFRRAAQLYRAQGDMANYRDVQQTLKGLGTAGRSWPYQVLNQVLVFVLRPFSPLFGRFGGGRRSSGCSRSSSRPDHRSSGASSSTSPSAGSSSGFSGRSSSQTRRSPSTPNPFKDSVQKPFKGSSRNSFQESFREQVYWAPGVSSRPSTRKNMPRRSMSGMTILLKLLSNPAGELPMMYEQVPGGKRGVVGYALAVLANLCFVFGATQYFIGSSSWLLASCLWASGGLMFVTMVLVLSVVRVWWMRIQGLWTADIFILGTTMLPLGVLAIVAGIVPAATAPLATPWAMPITLFVLLTAAIWAFSQAAIALHNGLYHIHQFSGPRAAWLSPVILGLGLAAGAGTYYWTTTFFFASVAAVSV